MGVHQIDVIHPVGQPARERVVRRPLPRRVPDLVVQREDIGLESVVPREGDALRCRVTREQPGLDAEHRLRASQSQHRQLRATGIQHRDDPVDTHSPSMLSECGAEVNGREDGL